MSAYVATRNFPDLTSTTDRQPLKTATQNADTPELLLVSRGITGSLVRTNTGTGLRRRYDLRLVSGELTTHEKLHPVEFAVFLAIERLVRTNKTLGLTFVRSLTLVDGSTVLQDVEDGQRGTRGWITSFGIDVEFSFTLDMLQIEA